ncbi:16S rRNA (cytidine(1402)-2'-O)-methyltransferase [Patescibacteria group bacterium]|nr:16S rRNA (cytidine(1402)-2'-O)-methyltransferase [Patescibacteria group bacterium]MBU1922287.1 16S rRNA (cytidine(1402)-2'-O)-methyltransferase [Patescibacteria group bacterium]
MRYFYIIATPIGNLEDMSERGVRILKEVDFVLCEDTRVTRKLLARFNIGARTISYHQHSKLTKINQIKDLVNQGKNIALVSDAGTPAISDPGGKLVRELVAEFGNEIKITPVPGPSALVAALSVSGFPADKFVFMGFPPHKKGRQKFWQELGAQKYTVVFYESPHRILKSLDELAEVTGERPVMAARELTKKFETIYRGTALEIKAELAADTVKGEFVLAVSAK